MTANRVPINRQPHAPITAEAVAIYRRLQAWSGMCTCPPNAPYPGHVFNAANPEHPECRRQYELAYERYVAQCELCLACSAQAAEEAALLRALRITLKPWQGGIGAFPKIVRGLEAALAAAPGSAEPGLEPRGGGDARTLN